MWDVTRGIFPISGIPYVVVMHCHIEKRALRVYVLDARGVIPKKRELTKKPESTITFLLMKPNE